MQGTRSNESRRFTRVYSTIYVFIQQGKFQETTREKRMGPCDQSTRKHTKGVKYQSLCNDGQGI